MSQKIRQTARQEPNEVVEEDIASLSIEDALPMENHLPLEKTPRFHLPLPGDPWLGGEEAA